MGDPTTPRVFVSYSRGDSLEFARRLHGLLEGEGLSLYRDLADLEGGDDWWRQVEAAIRTVEHVVLVLSPAALRSQHVAREWKLARQEGRKVSPVSGPGALDFSNLPRWMARAHRHDIDIPESRARLVEVLRGPPGEKRVPFMADALPDGFVPRPEPFERLKRSLLDARGEPVAITAALRGAGGYGKTVLANALCHDGDIQDAFSDGILRVTLGEQPDDLVGRIVDLVETLTGERPGFHTLDAAKVALADALDDRRCLLVIDDAWRVQDVAPFLHRGPKDQTTRLVTTRDDGVLPPEAARVAVDAMTSAEAEQMLARGIPDAAALALRPRLTAVAGRLGEWPLVCGLASGVIRARMARGASAADAVGYVERAIEQRGLARAFAADTREGRRRTASGTLEISLEQLGADERARFEELAVFVEDAEIPTAAVVGLWRQTAALDPLDGEDLLARLGALSLLSELDLGRGVLRVHDVVRTLLREGPVRGRLGELDRNLVAHFRDASGNSLTQLHDAYGLRHLVAHLIGAGETATAQALLAEPEWLSNKLHRLGVQPLLADYATLTPRDRALDLIRAALTLAAPALARNPKELASQLLARLAAGDAAGMDEFLARTRRTLSPPALVAIRPTFTGPGAELRRFEGHKDWVTSVAVLTDGRHALSGSNDRTLRLWDLDSGAALRRFVGHEDRVTGVAVLADGRRAVSGSWDRTLRLWDLKTGAELRRLDGHQDRVTSVTALADGRRALSGSVDRTVRLWDVTTGAELRQFEGHTREVTSVTMLADGRRALSGSHDRTLRLWDVETGVELRRFDGHEDRVTSVAALADGRRALSGSSDRTLRLWDLETGAELQRFEAHDWITSVTGLVDSRYALSGSWDRTLRLWDLETSTVIRRFEGHEDSITSVTVGDARVALSGSTDGTLRLWDLESAEPRRWQGHEMDVTSVMALADGRRALTGSWDRTVRLSDLDTGAELLRFEGHENMVTSVSVLTDGLRALSGSFDRTLRLWDLETGAELRRFAGEEGRITSVTALADGRRALSGSDDRMLLLWDVDTGTVLARFEGHGDAITCVTALADGRRALSGSGDRTLRLWDLETGAELRRFDGHEAAVTSVAALPDGRRALSGSADRTLRLWDLETGAELARLTFDATPTALASSADTRVVVGDARGRVHVFDSLS